MASGNNIIVSGEPRGRRLGGLISGALLPGIVVQMQVGTPKDGNGWHTWEAYNETADGVRHMIAVLLPDSLQGKEATEAYVDGDPCFLYFPLPGDELNMIRQDVAGTADDVVDGDQFQVDDGTGELIAIGGSEEAAPFQAMEPLTDPTADNLLHVIFTGY